jgi:PadR family transcriptional regulator, regulatory protein PadR
MTSPTGAINARPERESYGYEVVQRLREVGLSGISESTVYPALSRLEREGRISARLASSSAGPARMYYRPTPAGRAALTSGTTNWRSLADLVNAVLAGPIPSTPSEGNPK